MKKDSIIASIYLSIILLLLFLGTQIIDEGGSYFERHMLRAMIFDFAFLAPIIIVPLVLPYVFPVRFIAYIALVFISSFILLKTKYNDGFAGMAVILYQAYIFILMVISFPLLKKLRNSSLENPQKIYKILTTILIIVFILTMYSINKDFQYRKSYNKNIKLLLDIRTDERNLA